MVSKSFNSTTITLFTLIIIIATTNIKAIVTAAITILLLLPIINHILPAQYSWQEHPWADPGAAWPWWWWPQAPLAEPHAPHGTALRPSPPRPSHSQRNDQFHGTWPSHGESGQQGKCFWNCSFSPYKYFDLFKFNYSLLSFKTFISCWAFQCVVSCL